MPDDADLMLVRAAALQVSVSRYFLDGWIWRGQLAAQPSSRGALVSLAAVRALVEARRQRQARATQAPREIPGDEAEYVLPYRAAQLTGVSRQAVSQWSRTGQVASRPGRYGRLVRLVDVQASARGAPGGTEAPR